MLHLDASPRGDRSLSRTLSARFVERWAAARPGCRVIRRDLARTPIPHVDEAWVAAAFTAHAAGAACDGRTRHAQAPLRPIASARLNPSCQSFGSSGRVRMTRVDRTAR
ncbi:MAG: NAD(P)H-dependent oxidoreductase [Planctomycetota bacterium]